MAALITEAQWEARVASFDDILMYWEEDNVGRFIREVTLRRLKEEAEERLRVIREVLYEEENT